MCKEIKAAFYCRIARLPEYVLILPTAHDVISPFNFIGSELIVI